MSSQGVCFVILIQSIVNTSLQCTDIHGVYHSKDNALQDHQDLLDQKIRSKEGWTIEESQNTSSTILKSSTLRDETGEVKEVVGAVKADLRDACVAGSG